MSRNGFSSKRRRRTLPVSRSFTTTTSIASMPSSRAACRTAPDAEDLTAEVFHQALAKVGQFEWRGVPFAAWLYRIAANAIADRWQRASREKGSPVADDPPDVSGRANPEEVERRARIFRLVAELPSDQRRVIEMRFAEEKSIAEIARELKRSAGAIKQLQFRALTTLRARSNRKASEKPSRKSGGRNG